MQCDLITLNDAAEDEDREDREDRLRTSLMIFTYHTDMVPYCTCTVQYLQYRRGYPSSMLCFVEIAVPMQRFFSC